MQKTVCRFHTLGNLTEKKFLRNFSEYPKILRRDPDKILQYLAKEFAVPAQLLGQKAMFMENEIQ